jgi:hypothetical protein
VEGEMKIFKNRNKLSEETKTLKRLIEEEIVATESITSEERDEILHEFEKDIIKLIKSKEKAAGGK